MSVGDWNPKMSKYNDEAVERLIKASENVRNVAVTTRDDARFVDEFSEAIEALRPKPEMEYVLDEEMPPAFKVIYETIWNHGLRNFKASPADFWRQLREATRTPARPKVRAITAQELRDIYNSIAVSLDRDIWPEIADAINAKQGGQ